MNSFNLISFKFKRFFFNLFFLKPVPDDLDDSNQKILLKASIAQIRRLDLRSSGFCLDKLREHSKVMEGSPICSLFNIWEKQDLLSKYSSNWKQLNGKAQLIRELGCHFEYEKLLKAYDPRLQFLSKRMVTAQFYGFGLGDSLNVYRKIFYQGLILFEKVFQLNSADFQRFEWFEAYVRKDVEALGYEVPKVHKILKGKKLCIVYFEFIEKPLDDLKHPQKFLLEIESNLSSINLSQEALEAFPFENSDFTKILSYQKCKETLKLWLKDNALDYTKIDFYENIILQQPRVFCHGDLHGKNVGNSGLIIDWDRAGIYPSRFDMAYVFSNTFNFISISDFNDKVESLNLDDKSNSEIFTLSYFLAIFYIRKIGERILPLELKNLMDYLEKSANALNN